MFGMFRKLSVTQNLKNLYRTEDKSHKLTKLKNDEPTGPHLISKTKPKQHLQHSELHVLSAFLLTFGGFSEHWNISFTVSCVICVFQRLLDVRGQKVWVRISLRARVQRFVSNGLVQRAAAGEEVSVYKDMVLCSVYGCY